ncbi:MAG: DUF58 domain-containing protein [Candidatus Dormibacteria bacterium]
MTARPTPRLLGYAILLALGLLAALTLDRVAVLALVAPFGVWLGVGLALSHPPRLRLRPRLLQDRAAEQDPLTLELEVESDAPLGWLDLRLILPPGISCSRPGARVRLLPPAGRQEQLRWELRAESWGSYRLGQFAVRAQDRLGLVAYSGRLGDPQSLKVFPARERLLRLLAPARTQVFAGNRIARQHREGIEFADIRAFAPGDLVRRINWRVTARSGRPHVNDFHLERNSDVVLFVDSFSELRSGRDSVLTLAVRAAGSLAQGYLGERDRVGLVGFGGLLNWLLPGTGPRHLYRIAEVLLDTELVTSYAWKAIDVIPPRVLPPAATVIALSPLLDPRSVGALADLHHRGFDLLVLEIAPERFLPSGPAAADPSAVQLWRLLRSSRRRALQRAGVIVVEWHPDQPLEAVLAQAREYRRFARTSAA